MNTSAKTSNGLAVGDRVVDFRGELTGTVVAIETDRGSGRSDKVTVSVDGELNYHGDGPLLMWNYCSVWSSLTRPSVEMECRNCGLDLGSFDRTVDVAIHFDECGSKA